MDSQNCNTLKFNIYHLLSFLIICILTSYFLNYGSFDFLRVGAFGKAYDSLAQSLLDFQITVEPGYISKEKFVREGKTFMYFGPFPSFIRMPFLIMFPKLFGLLGSYSKFIAYITGFIYSIKIALLGLNQNPNLKLFQKQFLLFLIILGFGLASPLFNSMTHLSIFTEAIIWGLSLTIIALYLILKNYIINDSDKALPLIWISTLTGLALLTRVTFAIPLFIILIYLILRFIQKFKFTKKKIILALLPFGLCASFQLWYNYERFGNIASFANFKYYGKWLKARETSEKRYQEKINIKGFTFNRIPGTFKSYFLYQEGMFQKEFPFFKVFYPEIRYTKTNNEYEFIGQVYPFSFTYSWLFIVILFGLYNFIRKFKKLSLGSKIVLASLLVQSLLILMYKGVNHRYQADFTPLGIYLLFFYLKDLGSSNNLINKIDVTTKTFIILLSIITTSFYSLNWRANSYMWEGPKNQKEKTKKFIKKVNNYIPNLMKEYLIKEGKL